MTETAPQTGAWVAMRRVPGAAEKEVERLQLLSADLNTALATAALWNAHYRNPATDADRLISGALGRDAIVSFLACFDGGGKKLSLEAEEVFPDGPDNALAYFRYVKDLRDSHIAHRFGSFRQVVANASFDPETRRCTTVGSHAVVWRPDPNQMGGGLEALIRRAALYVDDLLEKATDVFQAEARALTPDEVDALPYAAITVAGAEDIRTSRQAFVKRQGDYGAPPPLDIPPPRP